MDQDKKVECRIIVAGALSVVLAPETSVGLAGKLLRGLWGFAVGLGFKWCKFVKKAWEVGVNDPRKIIRCLKVGIALTAVSLFYYMKLLYDGVGGNAMWAVMTVVVVYDQYTAGATISKTLNRIFGSSLAAIPAFGVHWVASRAGDKLEPLIVSFSLFLLASAAAFIRFIPSIKTQFDYGALIFILTYSFVSISGYRVDELWDMEQQRICTIVIGTSMCIVVSTIICPIWAGQELFVLITGIMDKLANSLEGCVAKRFGSGEAATLGEDEVDKKLLGYKCVLGYKATEDSMANFARCEPGHGSFNFRHPWKQYLKIGASMRSCASCIDALIGCINSDNQAPDEIKKHISSIALKVGTKSASVIRELATTIRNMSTSSTIHALVQQMNTTAQELQDLLKSYPNVTNWPSPSDRQPNAAAATEGELATAKFAVNLMDVFQVATVASLLIVIVARVEGIVNAVEELAELAEFHNAHVIKPIKQNIADEEKDKELEKTPEMVRKNMKLYILCTIYIKYHMLIRSLESTNAGIVENKGLKNQDQKWKAINSMFGLFCPMYVWKKDKR